MSSSCIPLIRIGLMIESVSLYAEAETKPAGSSAFCILVVPGLPPFFNVNLWRENLHATAAVHATAGADVCHRCCGGAVKSCLLEFLWNHIMLLMLL